MNAKQEAQALLEQLPDDCSIEDIQYHLYVLHKIRQGLTSAETGTLTQAEVEQRLEKWLQP